VGGGLGWRGGILREAGLLVWVSAYGDVGFGGVGDVTWGAVGDIAGSAWVAWSATKQNYRLYLVGQGWCIGRGVSRVIAALDGEESPE